MGGCKFITGSRHNLITILDKGVGALSSFWFTLKTTGIDMVKKGVSELYQMESRTEE
jgi:hypothetical protein